jgi:cell division protein FtsB
MAKRRSRKKPGSSKLQDNINLVLTKGWWIIGGFALLIVFKMFIFNENGVFELLRLRKEVEATNARIEELEIQNAELEMLQDRLLSDPEYLEKLARERFRMAKPGEKVFQVYFDTKK